MSQLREHARRAWSENNMLCFYIAHLARNLHRNDCAMRPSYMTYKLTITHSYQSLNQCKSYRQCGMPPRNYVSLAFLSLSVCCGNKRALALNPLWNYTAATRTTPPSSGNYRCALLVYVAYRIQSHNYIANIIVYIVLCSLNYFLHDV